MSMCKSIEIGEMNKLIRTTHLFDASQSDRLLCILWRRLVFRPSGTMTKKFWMACPSHASMSFSSQSTRMIVSQSFFKVFTCYNVSLVIFKKLNRWSYSAIDSWNHWLSFREYRDVPEKMVQVYDGLAYTREWIFFSLRESVRFTKPLSAVKLWIIYLHLDAEIDFHV